MNTVNGIPTLIPTLDLTDISIDVRMKRPPSIIGIKVVITDDVNNFITLPEVDAPKLLRDSGIRT